MIYNVINSFTAGTKERSYTQNVRIFNILRNKQIFKILQKEHLLLLLFCLLRLWSLGVKRPGAWSWPLTSV